MDSRRGKIEICRDILDIVAWKEMTKSEISNRCNLNFKRMKKYLTPLRENDLVGKEENKYYLTEKGKRFLELYEEMSNLVPKFKRPKRR